MIRVHKLSKLYAGSEQYALKPLSFSIKKGEIAGLLGPNGAGKTTLINILCGLIRPTSGTVEINGLNYRRDRPAIQQLTGIVPQEYALYPTLSATENLWYFGSLYGIPAAQLRQQIAQGLALSGLTAFAGKQVKTFSGGMKRRINLLAGTLHQPDVLFLDEPTVGVDVQSKEVIITMLKNLNDAGTTIIYTSHHLNEAEQFCTHIRIMDAGTVIADGTPQDIIRSVDGATSLEQVFIHLTGHKLRDYA